MPTTTFFLYLDDHGLPFEKYKFLRCRKPTTRDAITGHHIVTRGSLSPLDACLLLVCISFSETATVT